MNLNKVFILGRLTRNPDKRSLPNGNPVVSFGVATNRFYTDQNQEKKEETEFHNIVLFGKLADIASQYLQKGSLVLIEGRLRTSSWQDRENPGIKHYRTEIIGEKMQLGPRSSEQSNFNRQYDIQANDVQYNKVKNTGFNVDINKEDIPIIQEDLEDLISNPTNSTELPKEKEEEEIDVNKIPF